MKQAAGLFAHRSKRRETRREKSSANVVIGSDYGHADNATEIEALRRLRQEGEVSPQVINKILDDNARALYGL